MYSWYACLGQIVIRRCLTAGLASVVGWLCLVVGCARLSSPGRRGAPAGSLVSPVPLRIWLVGRVDQPELLARQWRAYSDQPIEVRALSVAELLDRADCPADVVLFPSRLLGELLQRQWIVKLPASLLENAWADGQTPTDTAEFAVPAGLATAASYEGVRYGQPLGFAGIRLIASATADASPTSWPRLIEQVVGRADQSPEFEQVAVDADALVDRFLAVAFAQSEANPKYGILFDAHTMKARLNEVEFQLAARVLQALASQPGGVPSVLGSHAAAWTWVGQSERPAYALVSPTELGVDLEIGDAIQEVAVTPVRGWNSGAGILAALTSQCRQSAQSTRFIRWLAANQTLEALRPVASGILSPQVRGNDLINRLAQQVARDFQDANLSCEPRLPGVETYRQA